MMQFRWAEKRDFEDVNRIARQVHNLHVQLSPELYRTARYPIPKGFYQNQVKTKALLLACEEDVILAYASFSVSQTELEVLVPQKILRLEHLCVDEQYRHKGIGKLLVQQVVATAKDRGCTAVQLVCNAKNDVGRAFYEAMGMQVINLQYRFEVL